MQQHNKHNFGTTSECPSNASRGLVVWSHLLFAHFQPKPLPRSYNEAFLLPVLADSLLQNDDMQAESRISNSLHSPISSRSLVCMCEMWAFRAFQFPVLARICKDGERNGILPPTGRGVYPIPDRGGGASGSSLSLQEPKLPGVVVVRQERRNDFVSKETKC